MAVVTFILGYPGMIPFATSSDVDVASGITPGYPKMGNVMVESNHMDVKYYISVCTVKHAVIVLFMV